MEKDGAKLKKSVYTASFFVLLIWAVKFIEFSLGLDFSQFGIYPRTLEGSVGIFAAPFIHGDILHLLSNTFPVFILGAGLFYFYDKIAVPVLLLIYIITGFWVWIAARDAYHVGASGIVYGLLTFLLFSGFFRKDRATLAFSLIVLFLYGTTLFTGVIPSEPRVSWESHLMGALAGIFCSIYFIRWGSKKAPTIEESDPEYEKNMFSYQYKITEKPNSKKPINYTYTFNSESDIEKD